jgi:hypothetical protein
MGTKYQLLHANTLCGKVCEPVFVFVYLVKFLPRAAPLYGSNLLICIILPTG